MSALDSSSRTSLVERVRALAGGGRRVKPGKVAVVRLFGPISDGGRTAEWVETVRALRRERRVPAVVLDTDSPGGSAAASDYLYLALRRLADKKPLVAHVRGVGASGAYLLSVSIADELEARLARDRFM